MFDVPRNADSDALADVLNGEWDELVVPVREGGGPNKEGQVNDGGGVYT